MWCNTLLQCVVRWIASGADDEQYRKKNGLTRGVLELVWYVLPGPDPPPSMVASPTYRGPGPLPKMRAGRAPTIGHFEGEHLVQVIQTKGGLRLPKALVMTLSWAPR